MKGTCDENGCSGEFNQTIGRASNAADRLIGGEVCRRLRKNSGCQLTGRPHQADGANCAHAVAIRSHVIARDGDTKPIGHLNFVHNRQSPIASDFGADLTNRQTFSAAMQLVILLTVLSLRRRF